MRPIHLTKLGPRIGPRFVLPASSVPNMGDFCARNLGLGHVAGLPLLAIGFAIARNPCPIARPSIQLIES
jgi:hypothetical protein